MDHRPDVVGLHCIQLQRQRLGLKRGLAHSRNHRAVLADRVGDALHRVHEALAGQHENSSALAAVSHAVPGLAQVVVSGEHTNEPVEQLDHRAKLSLLVRGYGLFSVLASGCLAGWAERC